MYMPDDEPHYRQAFNELYRRTQEQIVLAFTTKVKPSGSSMGASTKN
jgi:hypothetical protein